MRWARWGLMVVAIGAGLTALAQDRAAKAPARARDAGQARAASVSVQEALLRPIDLPFGEATTLEGVREHLAKALNAQVILDRAAMDRLELDPEDTVQLDLKAVRLKVGLKLLLDQVGMAFRVEPEDNLLVLTDPESSDDPSTRAAADLKALHREMHDLQDAVDDLRNLVEEELGVEPEVAKHQSTLVGRSKASPPRRDRSSPRAIRGPRKPRAGVGG